MKITIKRKYFYKLYSPTYHIDNFSKDIYYYKESTYWKAIVHKKYNISEKETIIKDNYMKSAIHYGNKEAFEFTDDSWNSIRDNYADVILMNISWQMGEGNSAFLDVIDTDYYDGDEEMRLDEHIADTEHSIEKWMDHTDLIDAIKRLDEREREILNLRYFIGKTQMEVSDTVGISQAQVSRLEKNALETIKKQMI